MTERRGPGRPKKPPRPTLADAGRKGGAASRGPQTKLTMRLLDQVEGEVAKFGFPRATLALYGISRQTHDRWIKQAKQGVREYEEYKEAVDRGLALFAQQVIPLATAKDPHKTLAKAMPDVFGEVTKIVLDEKVKEMTEDELVAEYINGVEELPDEAREKLREKLEEVERAREERAEGFAGDED